MVLIFVVVKCSKQSSKSNTSQTVSMPVPGHSPEIVSPELTRAEAPKASASPTKLPERAPQATLSIPTSTRTWHSADGREMIGRITELDIDAGNVTLVRADGVVFAAYPLNKLRQDDLHLIAPLYQPKKTKAK
jgi:hypothetical protein